MPAALVKRLFSGGKAAGVKSRIKDLGLTASDWFTYLFDFGDEWWHLVELVKIEERLESAADYPRVVEKRGQSPPQYPDWEEE